jgi:putative phosphoribosyl transferase
MRLWRAAEALFRNRTDAGRQLVPLLEHLRDRKPIVLALPRGGVPVGFEIARVLKAPLDLMLVRKLGAPFNPEYAIGAVVDGQPPGIFVDEDIVGQLRIPQDYIDRTIRHELAEIERRRNTYRRDRPPVPVAGRTVIVVDDGIATGATVRVALRALRQAGPERVILAVPVAPPSAIEALRPDFDEAVCVATPEDFGSIGSFYDDFSQLDDAAVINLLDRAAQDQQGKG